MWHRLFFSQGRRPSVSNPIYYKRLSLPVNFTTTISQSVTTSKFHCISLSMAKAFAPSNNDNDDADKATFHRKCTSRAPKASQAFLGLLSCIFPSPFFSSHSPSPHSPRPPTVHSYTHGGVTFEMGADLLKMDVCTLHRSNSIRINPQQTIYIDGQGKGCCCLRIKITRDMRCLT